jgi:iron complex transport system substrate-binding protein
MSRHLRPTRWALALAGASLFLGLAACSSDPSPSEDSGAGADDSTADTSAFPVTVEHKFGETTVESEPARVVTVGVTEQDTVLALGVVPVGVTDWYGDQPYATWPWAQDALGDGQPEVLTTSDGLEFEKIAELAPDLIIGTNAGLTKADYDKLSQIAPTVAQSGDYSDYFEPWDVQALAIGTAMGKEAEITEIIDGIKSDFADVAAEHPEWEGVPIVFLQNAFYDGSAIAYQDGLSTEFLTDLGFVVPPQLDEYAEGGEQAYIPIENLDVLNNADVLLWATEADADRATLEEEALYRNLDAVKGGHLVFTDSVLAGAIYFTSPLSLPYVLEELEPKLEAAVEGDPSLAPQ